MITIDTIETIGVRDALKTFSDGLKGQANNLQSIHTPYVLCNEIVEKLHEYTSFDGKTFCCLNLEFIEVLMIDFGVPASKIWFVTDCKQKARIAKEYLRYNGVNVVCKNFLNWRPKMKIDCVIGNPPYQAPTDNKGTGHTLWDRFAEKSFNDIVEANGDICLVHPSLWRKPDHHLRGSIKGLRYLEIHDEKDGTETFDAETRYDWYIAQKGYTSVTTVKDQNGITQEVDISSWDFIPNCDFNLVQSLLAKPGEEKVKIINDRTNYGADKAWMSDAQDESHKYPCVYMVGKTRTVLKWSSRNDNGHFGVPKVIYSSGRPISVGFLVDAKGEYGMTQWASGIVAPKKELQAISDALSSDKFRAFCSSISVSKLEINTQVLRCFRKDFWKEFL